MHTENQDITPDMVLYAYANGMFPMADNAQSEDLYWYDPPLRGQLSISNLHVPRKLRKTLRKYPYEIRVNTAFQDVIAACAEKHATRPETWINPQIIELFTTLHDMGFAHSVEAWEKDKKTGAEKLVGGVYGLALGAAFFGESMFSRATDASKIALVHLTARLWKQGFQIFDTQFINDHLKQFGIYEIPQAEYKENLAKALQKEAVFYSDAESALVSGGASSDKCSSELSLVLDFLQSINHTSNTG